eukprot:936574-Rhodomonas_salina.1
MKSQKPNTRTFSGQHAAGVRLLALACGVWALYADASALRSPVLTEALPLCRPSLLCSAQHMHALWRPAHTGSAATTNSGVRCPVLRLAVPLPEPAQS